MSVGLRGICGQDGKKMAMPPATPLVDSVEIIMACVGIGLWKTARKQAREQLSELFHRQPEPPRRLIGRDVSRIYPEAEIGHRYPVFPVGQGRAGG